MPAFTKLLLALATIIFLCVTLASAQTASSSAAAVATDVCEACRDGNCVSGIQFCGNVNISTSRLCCCPENAICEEESATSDVCRCLSPTSDKLQTNFLLGASGANSKHSTMTMAWVFIGIGAALIAALIAFTIYYKIKKRQNENNQQQ